MASEPFLAVDPLVEIDPHAQIFEQLRALIQRGELAPGALVPTVRQLARDLHVAPNTVARAYSDLQLAGWLQTDGRRGTRVADRVPTATRRVRQAALREAVAQFLLSLGQRGYTPEEVAEAFSAAMEAAPRPK